MTQLSLGQHRNHSLLKRSSDHISATKVIPEKRLKELHRLEKRLGFQFHQISLLDEAFTHRSYNNENKEIVWDNERLEFLGDSVLALIVNEFLFREFPATREGVLASIKSRVVSEPALARIAEKLKLTEAMQFGKGEEDTGGRARISTMANLMEALLGALYLDGGLEKARNFILQHVQSLVKNVNKIESIKDYKTQLQEYCQKHLKTMPQYSVLEETGPDHEREFTVKVFVKGLGEGIGKGKNKRKAEQLAAGKLLHEI